MVVTAEHKKREGVHSQHYMEFVQPNKAVLTVKNISIYQKSFTVFLTT